MKLLWMNLSHYWKRPAYLVLLPFICMMLLPMMNPQKRGFSMNLIPIFWVAMIGSITYSLQMEGLSRPFSFLLPGHRRVFRWLVAAGNLFWPLLPLAVIFLSQPPDTIHRIHIIILVLSLGNLAYWLGIGYADKTQRPHTLIQVLVPFFIFAPMLLDTARVEAVLFNPIFLAGITAASIVVAFRKWRKMLGDSLFRVYCGMNHGGYSFRNMQQVRRQQYAAGIGKGAQDIWDGIETLFLNRISRTRHRPIAPFVYGAIYQGLGPSLFVFLKSNGLAILALILLFLFYGYYDNASGYLVWIPFLFMFCAGELQVHSTFLLTRGRTQRYIAEIASLLFTTVMIIGFAFACRQVTQIVEPYMPSIHLRSLKADFHAVNLRLWYLFAAAAPLMAMLRLMLYRRFAWFLVALPPMLMGGLFPVVHYASRESVSICGGWIILILPAAWGVFAAYLYRRCFCKDLTRT